MIIWFNLWLNLIYPWFSQKGSSKAGIFLPGRADRTEKAGKPMGDPEMGNMAFRWDIPWRSWPRSLGFDMVISFKLEILEVS